MEFSKSLLDTVQEYVELNLPEGKTKEDVKRVSIDIPQIIIEMKDGSIVGISLAPNFTLCTNE
jgi:hypothetical protein